MKKSVGLKLAATVLITMWSAAIFADFLSPNPPDMQDLNLFYHPPSRIHILKEGRLQGRPFIYKTDLIEPLDATYHEKTDAAYPLEFFYKGYRYSILGLFEWDRHLIGRSHSPRYYPLGTDELGRDVFARVLAGARTSLFVVTLGVLLHAAIGLVVGVVAGWKGGRWDSYLMRFSEFVLALPSLYLLLALRSLMPMRISFWQSLTWIVGAIAAVSWPAMARGVRGLIFQIKNAAYIEAARSLGGTPIHIFAHHIMPAIVPFILAQLTLAAPIFLLSEIVLSFLNVGFHSGGESWGTMLRGLKDTRVITDFWWNLAPLVMVFITLLSFTTLSGHTNEKISENQVMRM